MSNSIFINYRRDDTQHAAIALAERLKWAFGEDEVFLDRTSLKGADIWPTSLKEAVIQAKVVVPVIGKGWLKTWDEHGRRRIDKRSDWVRRELELAIRHGKKILPVTLDGVDPPPRAAVDKSLWALCDAQTACLHASSWHAHIRDLTGQLGQLLGVKPLHEGETPVGSISKKPADLMRHEPLLTPAEVADQLRYLQGWRAESNFHAWAIGGTAQEIARTYEFKSFPHAIGFMAEASEKIKIHHPRWQNQWQSVKVWFSTWDVGCRVTRLDIEAARNMDALYAGRNMERCG